MPWVLTLLNIFYDLYNFFVEVMLQGNGREIGTLFLWEFSRLSDFLKKFYWMRRTINSYRGFLKIHPWEFSHIFRCHILLDKFCSFCLTGVNRRFQTYYLLGPSTSSCLVILCQRWSMTKVWKNVNIYCHKLFLFSQCWYLVVHAQLISMSRCVLMMSRLSILLYWSKTHRIYKKWT